MPKGHKPERRGSGPVWFLILAVVLFGLYSAVVAIGTADQCSRRAERSWQVFPPEWKCSTPLPGYG